VVHRGFMGGSLGMGGMVVHRWVKCNIPPPLLPLFIPIKKKGWGGGGAQEPLFYKAWFLLLPCPSLS